MRRNWQDKEKEHDIQVVVSVLMTTFPDPELCLGISLESPRNFKVAPL